VIRRSNIGIPTIFIWSLLIAGCSPAAELLIVEVPSWPANVQALRFTATLNGHQAMPDGEVTGSPASFGLLLDPSATGPFALSADGIDSGGCVVAHGTTDTTLTGANRVRMTLPLLPTTSPWCPK
jgi:hypothetical protein